MVPRAYTILGVAAASVLTAMVAATLTTESVLGRSRPDASPVPSPDPAGPRPRGIGAPGIPQWVTVTMTVLLALYALGLFALVAFSRWRRDQEDDEPASESDGESLGDQAWQTVLAVDLRDMAEARLGVLHRGTPRNAIVACWMALHAATVKAGLPEVSSETAEEFMLRAVRALGLDPPAVTELAGLYREARFSDHEMLESQRDRAGTALRVLVDQLGRVDDLRPVGSTRASTVVGP